MKIHTSSVRVETWQKSTNFWLSGCLQAQKNENFRIFFVFFWITMATKQQARCLPSFSCKIFWTFVLLHWSLWIQICFGHLQHSETQLCQIIILFMENYSSTSTLSWWMLNCFYSLTFVLSDFLSLHMFWRTHTTFWGYLGDSEHVLFIDLDRIIKLLLLKSYSRSIICSISSWNIFLSNHL